MLLIQSIFSLLTSHVSRTLEDSQGKKSLLNYTECQFSFLILWKSFLDGDLKRNSSSTEQEWEGTHPPCARRQPDERNQVKEKALKENKPSCSAPDSTFRHTGPSSSFPGGPWQNAPAYVMDKKSTYSRDDKPKPSALQAEDQRGRCASNWLERRHVKVSHRWCDAMLVHEERDVWFRVHQPPFRGRALDFPVFPRPRSCFCYTARGE